MARARTIPEDRRGTYAHESGAEIRWHWTPGGYMGSTSYEVEGDFDQVTAGVESVKREWPPGGYGTWFNWPPGERKDPQGNPIQYRAPTDLGDGRWIGRGNHSNSSD